MPPRLTRVVTAELLARHGIRPSRALGQNFVVEPGTADRIARLANVGPGDPVVEVGPGAGALTLALVDRGAHVTAVELDRHLLPALEEVLAGAEPPVRLLHGDALTIDWDDVLGGAERWSLVANLPYNVATPLVLDLLDGVPAVDRMTVMVQLDVAERLVAKPGTKAYGIPSVKVAYHATGSIVARIGRDVFLPRPNVESAVVQITRRTAPPTSADPARLFGLVRTGFGQRRKMLRRSLAGVVDDAGFAAAGVSPQSRPEQLGVEEWGRLAEVGR